MAAQDERLPRAYALALWLRDLGFNDGQIASALDVAVESIPSMLEVAELKRGRVDSNKSREFTGAVVVFAEDADRALISDAAALAEHRRTPLLLVATRGSASKATQTLLDAAQSVLQISADIDLLAVIGERETALRRVTNERGEITVISRGSDK